ncbi:myosin light chain kinase family member 4 isoform X2 [Nerophis ophidion]|uniref:myosin light chain kinase family member 4 isoform X2 n=1 Tax=Nerophis ophidion TaxID=159077 RepID=UPI002AE067DA|nr:myosin light chain kinase family member 4 isoform X2 [Nerophis ophidion]
MRDMGGNEKKILVIANVPSYERSDKKIYCEESGKTNGNMPTSAVPPPIPMSPIVEKMEGLKSIRNRSNSLRFGRLAFYRHLEKVGTMRCFWELKHIELEGGNQQDTKNKGKLKFKSLKAQTKKRSLETSESLLGLPGQVDKIDKKNVSATQSGEETEDSEEDSKLDNESTDIVPENNGDIADVSPQAPSNYKDISTKTEHMFLFKQESSEDVGDVASCSKRRVTEESLVKDDLKKSRVEDIQNKEADELVLVGEKPQHIDSDAAKTEVEQERNNVESDADKFFIDSSPPPTAPFDHRIVTPKPHQIATYYSINKEEVLGGGRFGLVHKCVENSSGLTLAAKIIRAKSQKEKDLVRNEIQVMNQLNHSNLIQLYAAFESRHDIILIMEYVEGGELFDRIIDENCNLTEFDTVLFIRQICEGLQYMHKMYILHLDLKPENILCVSRATNKIKIIDFGLARRYRPREKLKVNFGTPEFLAPEVINYEFVSFPTDMWSLGVITYMLLSGLSPFLGDDDNETLNNILACQWNFEEEEFTDVSDEAKDFITRLLVKSKSWRMGAAESLRHPWLSDQSLHYKLHLKKNKNQARHAPSVEC